MGYVGIDSNKFLNNDIWGSISSIYWENVPNLGVGGGGGGVKILLISVLMISGVQSHLSIGKMFPISGLGGVRGGIQSHSFYLGVV